MLLEMFRRLLFTLANVDEVKFIGNALLIENSGNSPTTSGVGVPVKFQDHRKLSCERSEKRLGSDAYLGFSEAILYAREHEGLFKC
jgi:hypothetical protein